MYKIAEEIEVKVNIELIEIEMKKTIILSIFFCSFSVKAQDNLLNLLSQDDEPI